MAWSDLEELFGAAGIGSIGCCGTLLAGIEVTSGVMLEGLSVCGILSSFMSI
jgi:hypothetical protein